MTFTTTKSLTSQAAHVFSSGVIQYVIKFATPIILVRIFTKEDYGLYSQVSLLAITMFAFIDLGYTNSLYYLFAKHDKEKSIVVNLNFLLNITGLIVLPLLLIFGKDIISLLVKDPAGLSALIIPLSIYSVMYALTIFIEAVFVVQQRTKYYMYFSGIFASLRLVLLVSVVYFTHSVLLAIYALIAYQSIRWIFSFFYIRKHFGTISFVAFRQSFKKILPYSFPLGLGGAAESINARISSLILIGFLNPAQYAIYAVAGFRLPLMNLLYGSITAVIIPKITELTNNIEETRNEIIYYWQEMTAKLFAISFPFVVFQIALAKSLMAFLFTAKYIDSAPIFRILLLTYIASCFPVTAMLRAFNKTRWIFKVNIVFLIFTPAISFLLISEFGIWGAAWAFVTLMNLIWVAYALPVFITMKFSLSEFFTIKKNGLIFLLSVILSVPLLYLPQLTNSNLLIILIGGIYYFPVIYLLMWKIKLFNIFEIARKFIKK